MTSQHRKMTLMFKYFTLALFIMPTLALSQCLPADHPVLEVFQSQALQTFWVEEGWLITRDVKEQADAIDLYSLPVLQHDAQQGLPSLDAFSPCHYALRPHPEKTLVYQIGDLGTLFLYSQARVEVLFDRHLANKNARNNRQ